MSAVREALPRADQRPQRPRGYVRPMQGWWKRDPYFVKYMWREATALAVMVYAVELCWGIVRLSQGEAAWNGWVAAMRSPLALILNLVILVSMFIHAKSWFEIMPKTMPPVKMGGEHLPGTTITRTGWAVVVVVSVLMLALAWGIR